MNQGLSNQSETISQEPATQTNRFQFSKTSTEPNNCVSHQTRKTKSLYFRCRGLATFRPASRTSHTNTPNNSAFRNQLPDSFQRKQPPWTGRSPHRRMSNQTAAGNLMLCRQFLHQFRNGSELRFRRWLLFKITNQADPNAPGVHQRISCMSPVDLLSPAERRLDSAVRHTFPITNYKVIRYAQPRITVRVPTLTMLLMNGLHTASGCPGMMNHQILPHRLRHFCPPRLF